MLTALLLLVCVGAGLVGGVFFAFSNFVMKALALLPGGQGIAAMQRINAVVVNKGFIGTFVGTAVLAVICIIVAGFSPWVTARSLLVLLAGLCYLVGAFGVTLVFNVPRNQHLARWEAESSEARRYWPQYLREWLLWNHVRTAASLVSAVFAAAALAF